MSCHLPSLWSTHVQVKSRTVYFLVSCVLDLPEVKTSYGTCKINQKNVWAEILFSSTFLSKINEEHFFHIIHFPIDSYFLSSPRGRRARKACSNSRTPIERNGTTGTPRGQVWKEQVVTPGSANGTVLMDGLCLSPRSSSWVRGRRRQGADSLSAASLYWIALALGVMSRCWLIYGILILWNLIGMYAQYVCTVCTCANLKGISCSLN